LVFFWGGVDSKVRTTKKKRKKIKPFMKAKINLKKRKKKQTKKQKQKQRIHIKSIHIKSQKEHGRLLHIHEHF